eukprot:TRINITY_DN4451_c0_g1_i1.p1 TRINITY_DN4451_c0_g1~~TRINITY_DN4451_c0_g1_i1.p1  ORF type:complete len:284 (-),score=87.63 TRINITY_DN4451_c0_g1_i1:95-946(-)
MNSVKNIGNWLARGSLGLGLAFTLGKSCIYTVEPGYRAVIFDRFRGVLPHVSGEGMHLRIPIIQFITPYEVRTRYANLQSETGSRDLQNVVLTLRMLYRPVSEQLPSIHSKLGPNYDESVLPSIGNEVLKSVVAQYDAGELITQRELVSTKVRESLTNRAADFNIVLDDVSITHLSFGAEFTQSIEAKQVAQQEAERAKYVVQKTKEEKKAAIIRASGEAEAATLIGNALSSGTGFIELRKIEALMAIADTLSRSRNVTYVPNSGLLLNLPTGGPNPNQAKLN